MTELGFVVALELAGFVLAIALVEVGARRSAEPGERRVAAALERAAGAFLGRERGMLGALALAVAVAAGSAVAVAKGPRAGLALAAGTLIGCALSAAFASYAARASARAASGAAASARSRLAGALASALRASGAMGIGAETASTLGALAVLLGGSLVFGSGGAASPEAVLGEYARLSVGAYALGATLTAWVLGRASSSYRVAAAAGHRRALAERALDADDPQNPALVADLVGDELSLAAAASAALFAISAVATGAVLLMAATAGAEHGDAVRWAALPLVLRSFGVVASAAGILTARTEEAHGYGMALLRSWASAAAIAAFGLLGGCYWLEPQHWPALLGAGGIGLFASTFASLTAALALVRGREPLGDAVEPRATDAVASAGASLGHGLARAGLPLVALLGAAWAASALGTQAYPAGGALFGLLVFTTAFLALSPFALGVVAFAAVVKSARGVASLSEPDAARRLRLLRLDDLGRAGSLLATPALSSAAPLVAFGGALLLAPIPGPALGPLPAALFAALGIAFVIAQAGRAARSAALGAREVGAEVERQLASSAEGGTPILSDRYAPSYRSCEELCARMARSGPADLAAAFLPLVLLGSGLGLVYRIGGSRLAAAALATFVATAAVTALGAALAVDGARAVQSGARRLNRPERDAAGGLASIAGDVLADILSIAAGPAACSQTLLVTSLSLCLLHAL